ncbi:hypothetical protein HC026_11875 [Lactobacillus sp. LC28-10]|uniref:Uncharacterized protein n=1 Tax=Secundilactobacillus angelensis TaxID=2722706 RepID=A0ABX1L073_9LACO|nr:hypothetical protein [Secundilactobacillus angelensis]MCH5461335.1 hypothetical protein [Secundilactobacillus angelensis]NLR19587.1 hypothetical protein [Secundilactobacillus angelensis]
MTIMTRTERIGSLLVDRDLPVFLESCVGLHLCNATSQTGNPIGESHQEISKDIKKPPKTLTGLATF